MSSRFSRWRMRRKLRHVNWATCEADEKYKNSPEYHALLWLKAYGENRTAAEPRELFSSLLLKGGDHYALTIFRYL